MKRSNLALAVALGSTALLSGCSTMEQHGGKLWGVAAGAAMGALACDGDPACIAVGVVGGLILGDLYDKRQEELRKLAEEKNINLETKKVQTFNASKDNALEVAINEGGMFEVGSDRLITKARLDLMAIATIYRENPQKLLVIGHTDATGSDTFNQLLSERRARSVAKLFEEIGVPSDQIYFQGAGESQPIATNDTRNGRSSNRRVEIVEIDSEQSLAAYNLQRQNDRKYLAHSNRTSSEKEEIRNRVEATPKPEPSEESKVARKPDASKQAPSVKAIVDFGGKPATSDFTTIANATGDTSTDTGGISFSLFPKAMANTPVDLSPCFMNSPRVTGDIQNLGTGKTLDVAQVDMSDYLPGLNGSVWFDTVNEHMITYNDLYVRKDSVSPEGKVMVEIYEDYNPQNTADYKARPHVESYPGEDGLLLRTYFEKNEPLQCMDVVMAYGSSMTSKAGTLYYAKGQGLYQQNIELKRVSN